MDLKSKILLIAGPTASGKSKFAIQLAKKINGEIINADSMQGYKELKILTARPKKIDQKKIKHHLYGIQSVKKEFSSGKWLKHANKKVKEIRNNDHRYYKDPINSNKYYMSVSQDLRDDGYHFLVEYTLVYSKLEGYGYTIMEDIYSDRYII